MAEPPDPRYDFGSDGPPPEWPDHPLCCPAHEWERKQDKQNLQTVLASRREARAIATTSMERRDVAESRLLDERARADAAEARVKRLTEALRKFLVRYDELMPYVVDDRAFCQNHGIRWPEERNWKSELDALRTLAADGEGKNG